MKTEVLVDYFYIEGTNDVIFLNKVGNDYCLRVRVNDNLNKKTLLHIVLNYYINNHKNEMLGVPKNDQFCINFFMENGLQQQHIEGDVNNEYVMFS